MGSRVLNIIHRRAWIVLLLAVVLLAGAYSFTRLRIDVFPDPSPVLVQVFTDAEGMAPEETERFITYPVEMALVGLPGVSRMTSHSTFGLSSVSVYFHDDVDIYFARQLVAQKLTGITSRLPEFVSPPELGPITTGLGMVYIYALEGDRSAMEMRTLQDWVVKFQLQSVPGVAAVLSQGGDVRQFKVLLDPHRLLEIQLDVHDIVEAIQNSSANITAGIITRNHEESIVRGIGLFKTLDDLKQVVVKEAGGSPIRLDRVAEVTVGPAFKRGEALLNENRSVVSGIVMKLIGVNTAQLISDLDEKIARINAGLPEGIRVVPVYNQSLIVKAAFRTISEALLLGIILVGLVLFVFINDLRSALVSALSVPFAVGVTFIVMAIFGITADLMSFGGLAIGIGLLVDATVVMVENINRHGQMAGSIGSGTLQKAILEVLRPLLYAMTMIILGFIPILSLSGVEGKMFRPFGFTLLLAVTAAIFYAVLIAPALMRAAPVKKKAGSPQFFGYLRKIYLRIYDFCYSRPRSVMGVFGMLFLLSILIFNGMGSEFIPRLKEQTLQVEITLPQNAALDETVDVVLKTQRILQQFPEVQDAYGRIGRGEAGTHVHPVNVGHLMVTLKERDSWEVTGEDELIDRIRGKLQVALPGVLLNFTQPIKHNLDHLITGVRADLAVKVFGDDYRMLLHLGEDVARIMGGIEGVEDVQVARISGQNETLVHIDRARLARLGLHPGEILEEFEIAFGGKVVSRVYVGDTVVEVFVRYHPRFRRTVSDLNRLLIHTPGGEMVPLQEVARIEEGQGLVSIARENGKRYITVQCNVRGRDVGGLVRGARSAIYDSMDIPMGYYLEWGGQYELKSMAEKRLALILIITFALILLLIYQFVRDWRSMLVILVNLPVSLSGGVLSLWLIGAYLSVPSTIGFLALLGIALENTLVLITFFRASASNRDSLDRDIREAVTLRLRPILMTKFTTMLGLMPLLFSSGIGAEVQRPLAAVVIGGIFFSIFTTLLLMPVIYRRLFKSIAVR